MSYQNAENYSLYAYAYKRPLVTYYQTLNELSCSWIGKNVNNDNKSKKKKQKTSSFCQNHSITASHVVTYHQKLEEVYWTTKTDSS